MSVWVHVCTVYLTLSLVRTASYRLLHDCETESSDAEIKIKTLWKKKISLVLQLVWKQFSSCITDMMNNQSKNLK